MTLVSGPVSIQRVCVDNLMRIVQLILCLTVNKLSNNNCTYKCLYLRSVRSVSLRRKDTHTPARLEALESSSPSFVPPVKCNPSLSDSDSSRGPSYMFVPTRPTERRCSLIHCCMEKQRISMCLRPPGSPESESISRRTEAL